MYETKLYESYFLSHIKVENLFLAILIANSIAALVVLTLVLYRLNKRGGTSDEIKKQVSKRYLEFVMVFIFLNFLANQ